MDGGSNIGGRDGHARVRLDPAEAMTKVSKCVVAIAQSSQVKKKAEPVKSILGSRMEHIGDSSSWRNRENQIVFNRRVDV